MQGGYKSYRQVSNYLLLDCITNLVCAVSGIVVNYRTLRSMYAVTNLTEPIVTPDFLSNVSFTSLS